MSLSVSVKDIYAIDWHSDGNSYAAIIRMSAKWRVLEINAIVGEIMTNQGSVTVSNSYLFEILVLFGIFNEFKFLLVRNIN